MPGSSCIRITVIGSVNVDICGRPAAAFVPGDSNPGTVTTALGGVGANIARDLRQLGGEVRLITALGGDLYGKLAEEQLAREGLDLSSALRVPGARSSTYLYITDEAGDMRAAVADMKIQERLTPEFLETCLPAIEAGDGLVVDANLSEASLRYVCARVSVPIFADGVSAAKVNRLKSVLPRLQALKLNRIEAERLTGLLLETRADLDEGVKALRALGLRRGCVTLGAEGALDWDESEAWFIPPVAPDKLVNTTGAGDAFTAGFIWSLLSGAKGRDAAEFATCAASVALESDQAVNPDLSAARVRERRNEQIKR